MIKQWAQWKVGIAGASKAMWRIPVARRGTLSCGRCGSPGHVALFEGGLGKCCHQPQAINPKYTAVYEPPKPVVSVFDQSEETLALRRRVLELMESCGITARYQFARLIGIDHSGFNRWFKNEYAELGQRRMHRKISIGIERWLERINHEEIEQLSNQYVMEGAAI